MYKLDFEINEAAQSALDRIKNREIQDITESVEMAAKKSAISRERDMLDEFTTESLMAKLKTDKYIYDIMFANVQESEDVTDLINTMISKMSSVYESLNVAPISYKVSDIDVLNRNEVENLDNAKQLVESYMVDNLFKLSKQDKKTRYKLQVTSEAQFFIENYKVDTDKAIDFSYKSAVISNFLESVHFPKFAKIYLEDCMSSETYAEFFETDILENSFHDYQKTLKEVSQLIATTI